MRPSGSQVETWSLADFKTHSQLNFTGAVTGEAVTKSYSGVPDA